ncbi:hypothetical protein ACWDRZ_27335 [Streptomyces sp. NPDC003509]
MFVGGLSALLLQSLHPEAMTSVSAHPGSGATSGGGSSAPAPSSQPRCTAQPTVRGRPVSGAELVVPVSTA